MEGFFQAMYFLIPLQARTASGKEYTHGLNVGNLR
jgi:hypothetical protein